MHCSYYEPDLVYLWKDGKLGDNLIDDLLNQIDITAKFNIKNFIIHTCGDFNPPRSLIGIERIEKLLVKCNQYDINLCIENLYDFEQMKYIFDKIKNKNLKVCYDCGHNNCLNPQDDIFDYFKDKISVLHLHDNHGKPEFGNGDEHLMLGEGILNLDDIAKKISQLDEDIVLCAEYREKYNVDLDYFKRAKKSLDNLEELILKYKNKKK